MKGQTSLELMITVGIVVAFTIPVLFLLLSVTSIGYEDTAKAQADASSRTLADTLNSVYAQGPGAQKEILLNVPASTQGIYAAGAEAVIIIRTSGGDYDAASPTIAVLNGNQTVGKKSGLFTLIVRTNPQGKVEIVDPNASP